MSYTRYGDENSYGNQGGGGYGAYNPYSQQGGNVPPAQSQGYGRQGYSDVEQGNAGYEMGAVGGSGGTTAILNKCKEIGDGIQQIKAKRESQLARAQQELLQSSNEKQDQTARQNLDYIEDDINNTFRYLRDLMKKIKQTPGSGDQRVQAQIDVTTRNLRREIEQYQKSQTEFQSRLKDQVKRRYAIANPNATQQELEQGVQNVLLGQEQTFQVAGNRTRLANDARQATMERSAAIRKIEQDMIELGRLYQEVAELVQQQEPAVDQINQGAETVVDNVNNANKQIDTAIASAKRARKWKCYALFICIIIILIVVGVAVGVVEANRSK